MPNFTLHRNYVLRTTHGHSIGFIKDTPVWVPPVCVPEAIAIGARQLDGEKVDILGEEEEVKVAMTPEQRRAAVFGAFATMAARGERADFTASGVPNAKRLPAIMGFEITTSERDTYWQEYRTQLQEQKDQANFDAQLMNRTAEG